MADCPTPDLDPEDTADAAERFAAMHKELIENDLSCGCVYGCATNRRGCWPPPVLEPVLFLEREAYKILEHAEIATHPYQGDPYDREALRLYWVNEVTYLSNFVMPNTTTHAAIKVVTHGSELRQALVDRNAAAAALQMMCITANALFGGFFVQAMQLNQSEGKLKEHRHARQKGNKAAKLPYRVIERWCRNKARKFWESDSDYPLKLISEHLESELKRNANPKRPAPTAETIKKYLTDAHRKGLLQIPPGARKTGRPRKDQQ